MPARLFAIVALIIASNAFISLLASMDAAAGIQRSFPVSAATLSLLGMASLGLCLLKLSRTLWLWAQIPLIVILSMMPALSALWSIDAMHTLQAGLIMIGMLALATWLARRFSVAELIPLVVIALAISAILSILLVLAMPDIAVMAGSHEGRWRGIYGHKNVFGRYMGLGAVVALIGYVYADRAQRRYYAAAMALFGLTLIMAQSASALLIMSGVTAIWLALRYMRRTGKHTRYLVLPFVVAVLVLLASFIASDGTGPLVELLGRDVTLTGRTIIWDGVLRAAADEPLLGYGYDVFWRDQMGYAYEFVGVNMQWNAPHAHNGMLEVLIALGGIGLVLTVLILLVMIVRTWRVFWKQNDIEADFALLILLVVLATNMTEAVVLKPNLFWVLFMYLAMRLSYSRFAQTAIAPQGEHQVHPTR